MTPEERRAEQRKYEGDVCYDVWRSGGNPDRVDPDRLDNRYWNDESVEHATSAELRLQQKRSEIEVPDP